MTRTTNEFIALLRQEALTYKERLAFTARNIHEHDPNHSRGKNGRSIDPKELDVVRHKIRKYAYDLGGVNLKRAFRRSMDANHDGKLSYDEFVHSVRRMVALNDDQAAAIIRIVDADRNGYIEFEELHNFVFDGSSKTTRKRTRRNKEKEKNNMDRSRRSDNLERTCECLTGELERTKLLLGATTTELAEIREDYESSLLRLADCEDELERERERSKQFETELADVSGHRHSLKERLAASETSREESDGLRQRVEHLSRQLKDANDDLETTRERLKSQERKTVAVLRAQVEEWKSKANAARMEAAATAANSPAPPLPGGRDVHDERVQALSRNLEAARNTIKQLRAMRLNSPSSGGTQKGKSRTTSTKFASEEDLRENIGKARVQSRSDVASQRATLWMSSRVLSPRQLTGSGYASASSPASLGIRSTGATSLSSRKQVFVGEPLWRHESRHGFQWPVMNSNASTYERMMMSARGGGSSESNGTPATSTKE